MADDRFIAYFAVIGVGDQLCLSPSLELENESSDIDIFKASIEQRYPVEDYEDAPLPEHLPIFCFPAGLTLSATEKPPTFFCFTLTDLMGDRFYGACLHTYERLVLGNQKSEEPTVTSASISEDDSPPSEDETENSHGKDHSNENDTQEVKHNEAPINLGENQWAPKCLCILSRHPFYSTFRDCLRELFLVYRMSKDLPLEAYVNYLAKVVPLPKPGATVSFQLFHRRLTATHPTQLYFPPSDYSISCLFDCLGISKTLKLFSCVLAEQKIIFISSYYTMLTIAAEAITQLLLPFHWHHIFIPILPRDLLNFIEAPTPFIVGVHADNKQYVSEFSSFCTIVDLDLAQIYTGKVCSIPEHEEQILEQKLKRILTPQLVDMDLAFPLPEPMKAVGCNYGSSAMQPLSGDIYLNTQLKIAFLQFFISLFEDYRRYISFIRKFPEPVTIFNKAKYIKDHPNAVEFLTMFLETQAFTMFLEQHHQKPCNIFEEVIRAKQKNIPLSTLLFDDNSHLPPNQRLVEIPRVIDLYSKLESYQATLEAYRKNLGESKTHQFPVLRSELFPNPRGYSIELSESTKETTRPISGNFGLESSVSLDPPRDPAGSFITECVEQIVSGQKPLSKNQSSLLDDLLKLDSSRIVFATCLKNHSDQNRGVITELKPLYFDDLVLLTRRALEEANNSNDFSSPLLLISCSGGYRGAESGLFLHERFKDLSVWQNKYFWEAAFFDSVARERQALPIHFKVGDVSKRWDELSDSDQNDFKTKEANLLFGVLGSFALHMLNTGIAASEASMFLQQMSRLCDLDAQQGDELQTLVNNVKQINDILYQPRTTKRSRSEAREEGNAIRLNYFTSSKRNELDSTTLYRRLLAQKRSHQGMCIDELPSELPFTTLRTLYGHKKGISSLAVKYPHLASGSVNGEIKLWDLNANTYSEFTFQHHTDRITAILILDSLLITASQDSKVIIWDSTTGKIKHHFTEHTGAINSLDNIGDLLLSSSEDNSICLWSISGGKLNHKFVGHLGAVTCCKFLDQERFVSCSKDKTIRLWNVSSKDAIKILEGHQDWVKAIAVSAKLIVSCSFDHTARIWDISSGECLHVLSGHSGTITCLDFNDSVVATGSSDATVRIWDIQTGQQLHVFSDNTDEVSCLQLNSKLQKVFAGNFDSTTRCWEYVSGKPAGVFSGHTDWVYSIAVCHLPKRKDAHDSQKKVSSSHLVISGSWDNTIRVWERYGKESGKKKKKFSHMFKTYK